MGSVCLRQTLLALKRSFLAPPALDSRFALVAWYVNNTKPGLWQRLQSSLSFNSLYHLNLSSHHGILDILRLYGKWSLWHVWKESVSCLWFPSLLSEDYYVSDSDFGHGDFIGSDHPNGPDCSHGFHGQIDYCKSIQRPLSLSDILCTQRRTLGYDGLWTDLANGILWLSNTLKEGCKRVMKWNSGYVKNCECS